ncbi:hypothetical protein VBD025_15975 [Virgibacillus flavescens]|uniref:hypothetical protein n=1 Tax=Virgibacillus flavescens TaxID=1611422 RepID=UPI003D35312C
MDLNIVKGIIAVLGIGMFIYHFFIEDIPLYISSLCLALIFLFWGIEQIKDRSKSGYLYIVMSGLMSCVVVKELSIVL